MPFSYVDCPVCGEEVCYTLRSIAGGYPSESLAEVVKVEKLCDCTLTQKQADRLEDEAVRTCDWTPSEP